MTTAQATLFGDTIAERFERFHQANPHILGEITKRADQLIAAGATRVGLKQIFEVIRYDHAIRTSGEVLKLNNSYTSRYARLVIARRPDLDDYIQLRKLTAQ